MVDSEGQVFWRRYDTWGRCKQTADPKGNIQKQTYNVAGQIICVEEPDGNIRKLKYDPEGNVIKVSDKQHEIQFEYEGFDKLKARIENGTRVGFRYDTEEQLTSIVNEHGYVYQFDLDAEGNVELESGFDEVKRFYKRDAAGQVISVLRATGIETFYEYDMAGRVILVHHSTGEKEIYAYREDGLLMATENLQHTVTFVRDLLGRVSTEISDGIEVHATYDMLGRRIAVRSSLGANLRFDRNDMGDVLNIASGGEAPWEVQMRRDAMGMEMERTMPGGVQSRWKRDRLGRPIAHQISAKGNTKMERRYVWEVNNRLRQISDEASGTTNFTHDAMGNLVEAQYNDGTSEFRVPDALGNLFRTRSRSDRKYGPAGQLLEANGAHYQYDGEGNLIEKTESNGKAWYYTWNAAGMLASVIRPDGVEVTFTYDALGRRLSKTYRDKTTCWVWDGNVPLHEWIEDNRFTNKTQPLWKVQQQAMSQQKLQISAPYNEPPHTQTPISNNVVTWVFEPECFAPVAKLQDKQRYSIVTDHIGTPTCLFSEQGEKIWAADTNIYGQLRNLEGERSACPFRFQGQYEDEEIGLYYNRFRYYDPGVGLYVSQDPIGLKGGNQTFYAYVKDTNGWIDPLGLSCEPAYKTPYKPLSPKQRARLQQKLNNRTITRQEFAHLDWDRRFTNRRARGVDRFWSQERRNLRNGGTGTRNWTPEQRNDILAGRTPTHNGKPIEGHHKYNALDHPHIADDPNNIYPATDVEHLNRWHGGNYQNDTYGKPLNPAHSEEF
jgi:RHS repeat-associated protein